jgi:serine/threonine protein kinase
MNQHFIRFSTIVFCTIGEGSFGKVWKGRWRLADVAIKQVKAETINQHGKKERKKKKRKNRKKEVFPCSFFIFASFLYISNG